MTYVIGDADMTLLASIATLLAIALLYAASPHQRWMSQPLPAWPARGSAVLSALVAFKAWMHALTPLAGIVAGCVVAMLTAVLITKISGWLLARRVS